MPSPGKFDRFDFKLWTNIQLTKYERHSKCIELHKRYDIIIRCVLLCMNEAFSNRNATPHTTPQHNL